MSNNNIKFEKNGVIGISTIARPKVLRAIPHVVGAVKMNWWRHTTVADALREGVENKVAEAYYDLYSLSKIHYLCSIAKPKAIQ